MQCTSYLSKAGAGSKMLREHTALDFNSRYKPSEMQCINKHSTAIPCLHDLSSQHCPTKPDRLRAGFSAVLTPRPETSFCTHSRPQRKAQQLRGPGCCRETVPAAEVHTPRCRAGCQSASTCHQFWSSLLTCASSKDLSSWP